MIPDHEEILAQDLIDFPLLNSGVDVRPVREDKALHSNVDNWKEEQSTYEASENERIIEARERCKRSIVEGGPQVMEAIDLHEEEVPKLVEQRVEQVGDKGEQGEREKCR